MQAVSPFSTPLAPPLHRLEVVEVPAVQGLDRPVVVLNRVAVGVAVLPQSGELERFFLSVATFPFIILMNAYKSILSDEQRLVQNQPLDDLHAPRGGEAALVVVEPGEVTD